ncbi:hypothetical protein V8F20_005696 [Naviculisporaceae sp. PSN 640]
MPLPWNLVPSLGSVCLHLTVCSCHGHRPFVVMLRPRHKTVDLLALKGGVSARLPVSFTVPDRRPAVPDDPYLLPKTLAVTALPDHNLTETPPILPQGPRTVLGSGAHNQPQGSRPAVFWGPILRRSLRVKYGVSVTRPYFGLGFETKLASSKAHLPGNIFKEGSLHQLKDHLRDRDSFVNVIEEMPPYMYTAVIRISFIYNV